MSRIEKENLSSKKEISKPNFSANKDERSSLRAIWHKACLNTKLTYHNMKKTKLLSCLIVITLMFTFAISASLLEVLELTPIITYEEIVRRESNIDIRIVAQGRNNLNFTRIRNKLEGLVEETPVPRVMGICSIFPPSYNLEELIRRGNSDEFVGQKPFSDVKGWLSLIDFDLEKSEGIGLNRLTKPGKGEVVIESAIAKSLGVRVGDVIYINPFGNNFYAAFFVESGIDKEFDDKELYIPFKVSSIVGDVSDQISSWIMGTRVLVDLKTYSEHLSEFIPMYYEEEKYLDHYGSFNMSDFTREINFKLKSNKVYLQKNPKEIGKELDKKVVKMLTAMGYTKGTSVDAPVYKLILKASATISSLNVFFKLIIFGLILISSYVVYNMLAIKFQSDIYSVTIMRTIGMSKWNLVFYYILNSLFFSAFGIAFGLILTFFALKEVGKFMTNSGYNLNIKLSLESAWVPIMITLLVPLLSTLPVITAMIKEKISENLDKNLSKTKGLKINVEKSHKKFNYPLAFLSMTSSIVSLLLYILIPLALLLNDITLLGIVFLGLLAGLLVGITLIMINFTHILETAFTYIVLFFESKFMKTLVIMNLTAHRIRNRRTLVIYSLSLAFSVFLYIVFNLQTKNGYKRGRRTHGTSLVFGLWGSRFNLGDWRSFLRENPEYLDYDISLVFRNFNDELSWNGHYGVAMKNQGKIKSLGLKARVVTPNFLNITNPNIKNSYTSLTDTELMYTRVSDNSLMMSKNVQEHFSVDCGRRGRRGVLSLQRMKGGKVFIDEVECLSSHKNLDGVEMSSSPMELESSEMVIGFYTTFSLPTTNQYLNLHQFRISKILVDITEDEVSREKFKQKFVSFTYKKSLERGEKRNQNDQGGITYMYDYYQAEKEAREVAKTQDMIFTIILLICFLIGFLSLITTTITNLIEQKKEIAVLRMIGVTTYRVSFVFFYECFILLSVAIFLGNFVGIFLGWIFLKQSSIFDGTDYDVSVPWNLTGIMLGFGLVSSLLAGMLPGYFENRKGISMMVKND